MSHTGKSVFISLLACVILLSAGTGCSSGGLSGQSESVGGAVSDVLVPDTTLDVSDSENEVSEEVLRNLEKGSTSYGYTQQRSGYYNLMTDKEKVLYGRIEDTVYNIADEKNEKGYYDIDKIILSNTSLTQDEIKIAITAYKNDNPQVFWITNNYGWSFDGTDTVIQLYSYVSPSDCNAMIQEMETQIGKVVSDIGEDRSEFDRELGVFRAVVERCSYDFETAESDENRKWESYTAYGALVGETAVCEGYSRAIQLLLSYMGMESQLIRGTAGGVMHMWNLVKLDGNWYHLDATWNDQQDVLLYDYFNLTDKQIEADHEIAPELNTMTTEEIAALMDENQNYNFALPQCDSVEENYIQNYAIKIDNFSTAEDRRVISAFRSAAENQDTVIYLYISGDIDFDMAVRKIFKGRSPKILSYIDGSNAAYGISQINRNNVQYIMNETVRSITIKISYGS